MSDAPINPLFTGTPTPAPTNAFEAAAAPKNGRRSRKRGATAKTKAVAKTKTKKLPAQRYDLLKVLKATAGLREVDMPVFQATLAGFQTMGKPLRTRVLTAITRIFE